MTSKGQTRDPNTLTTQYLENSWRRYATIANYYRVGQKKPSPYMSANYVFQE